MNLPDPNSRWKRHYATGFYVKFDVMKQKDEKRVIYQRTIDIANHQNPSIIGGTVACPEGHYRKIKFNTGLVFIYEFVEPDIIFIKFYMDN